MTDSGGALTGRLSGLLLVAADAAAGWLLYGAVSPALGLVLWVVAALVACGLLVDGVGRIRRPSPAWAGSFPARR